MKTVLDAKDLVKTYHKGKSMLCAVDHVSLTIHQGECLGLVGESGSGKSTLARMITSLVESDQGTILLNGKVHMVFQNPQDSFDPRRTLGDGIMEVFRNHGVSKADAKQQMNKLLSIVELQSEMTSRYPHQVSGGQCQRAAIARAIAMHPDLVICDEATSALDVTVQAQIIGLLKKLQKESGISYLFISHDLALVQAMCSRVAVMHKGKIVEQGSVSKIIKHPRSDYTRTLINSAI